MPGLNMNMGLGGAGSYSGPVYGADGPAVVPASGGYPDTSSPALLGFGPSGVSAGPGRPAVHGLSVGLACFALLLLMAWALPR